MPIRAQAFPAESLTDVMRLVAPVYTLADRTSRCPDPVAVGNEPVSAVEELDSVAPADCTSAGPPPTAVTVRATGTAWVAEVPVPVTMIVEEPSGVEAEVVTVIVENCPAVTVAGLNETEVPLGTPVALKATGWAEPLVTAVETVLVPAEPWPTLSDVGAVAIEKSEVGGGRLPKV